MKTFEELANKMGKRLPKTTKPRKFSCTTDRPKVFPTDADVLWTATHPDGEVAGYIRWFEQRNGLKPTIS